MGIRSVYLKWADLVRGFVLCKRRLSLYEALSGLFSRKMPRGNDMIDASMENLMDSKADHRFTTVAWKSLGLYNNHLDKCFALTHITTSLTTADLICLKN